MKHLKLIIIGLGLVILSGLAYTGIASAQAVKTGDLVTVPAGETVDSLLFASGNNIEIAGTVNGDVYCAGQTIIISGTINGDVFCAGQTINLSGTVEGSVRLAAQTTTLSGTVKGDAAVASQTLLLEKEGSVGRDLVGGVQNASIGGVIGRDLAVGAESLTINSEVGRNITGDVQDLVIGSSGRINGDVIYSSNNSPVINTGGQIDGIVTRTPLEEKSIASSYAPFKTAAVSFVYVFVTVLILSLVLVAVFPALVHQASSKALKSPGRTSIIGFAAVILVPALIVVLAVSVIGLPLGMLILLGWLVVVLLSGPVAGYVLGRLILKDAKKPIMTMLLGVSILVMLSFIPILGFFVMLAIYIFGVGALLPEFSSRLRQSAPKKA